MGSLVAQRLPIIHGPPVRVYKTVSVHHAWRTVTLSPSLPPGIWLLRRLRPPARTRALSCPPPGGTSGVGVPQCQHNRRERPVAASSTPGAHGNNACRRSDLISPAPSHFGSGVSPPLSPRPRHDASHRGSLRPQRLQDSNGPPPVAGQPPPFSSQASDLSDCQSLTPTT